MDPNTLRADLLRLRGRLRRMWSLYGFLRLVAAVSIALAVAYVLDRNLSLPSGVRAVFLLLLVALAAWLLFRGIVYPLSRRLDADDIAGALEDRFPEFDGRLISALQLEGEALSPERNVSVALVEKLREETEQVRRQVDLDRVFDRRPLVRLGVAAACLLAIDLGYAAVHPDLARIFGSRLFMSDARWPRDTFLEVKFPEVAEYFRVEYEGERPRRVRIARGASLPVTVEVRGKRPEYVELRAESESGRMPSAALIPTGPSEWVGRFRGVREPFRFWPAGGDDDGHGRDVLVEVFMPPEILAVRTEIEFPAYTGLAPRSQDRGDVEAPVGSVVDVEVQVASAVEEGSIVFDGGAESLSLVAASDDATRLSGRFLVEKSRTWSVQLVGKNGFRNLEPVTFAVVAVPDRSPTVRVLEPARADIDVTPNGIVALRVAADDDFGVAGLEMAMRAFSSDEVRVFDLLAVSDPAEDPRRRLVYWHLDLGEQSFVHADMSRSPQAGDSYVYSVVGRDNHEDLGGGKAPNETALGERRIDIVSANEKLRLLTEQQIRLKDEVRAIREYQAEKLNRLRAVLLEYEESEGGALPEPDDLVRLEIAQGQMSTRATRLCRTFASLFEEYLLNRLDPSAAADRVIPMLARNKRASSVIDDFDFRVYRPLVESYESGAFGDLDVLGRILVMLKHILEVAEHLSPDAASAISEARLIRDDRERPRAVRRAVTLQEEILRHLDQLLAKMDEWEDFQEILTLFRDLLEDQRNLHERTKSELRGN